MAKLIIEIEGSDEDLEAIAGWWSDGGGEETLNMALKIYIPGRLVAFDYAECFPAWGWNGQGDRRIVGTFNA